VAFVTLCEAYMGIDPQFNLWNHFFHIWLPQGLGVEAAILGGEMSMSNLVPVLIPTSTSPCLVL
jgi:hypothetical protein